MKRNSKGFALDGGDGTTGFQDLKLATSTAGKVSQTFREISHGNGYYSYVKRGTNLAIDANNGSIDVDLSKEELVNRRKQWTRPKTDYNSGTLWKYSKQVGPARYGAVTHPGAKDETHCFADI